jgi:hypothetical protein
MSLCEENPKVSLGDSWRFINPFNEEDYKSRKRLGVSTEGLFEGNTETIRRIAEHLQILPQKELTAQTEKFLQTFSIGSGDIVGYSNKNICISLQQQVDNYFCDFGGSLFFIDTEHWLEKWDILPFRGGKNEGIIITICLGANSETTKIKLIQHITNNSMLPEVNLSLYKIEKGPGDVCLVHVNNESFLAE